MGQALLEGADHASVAAFLETLCPADIVNLAPGRQRYTQLLNESGGIVDDLMVTRPPSRGRRAEARGQRLAQGRRSCAHSRAPASRRPAHAARRGGADRRSGAAGRGDIGSPCARRGTRGFAFHGRPAGADRRVRDVRLAIRLHRRGRIRDFASRGAGGDVRPPAPDPAGCRSDRARRPRFAADSKPASASMATNSTRRSIQWRRRSPGRSRSGGGPRAAFPAPSAFRTRWRRGRSASASACGRTVARPRAKGRRSCRRMARRSASSPQAASARASARRSPWASSSAITRPSERRSALVVRGKPLSARVAAMPFHPHAYYRG